MRDTSLLFEQIDLTRETVRQLAAEIRSMRFPSNSPIKLANLIEALCGETASKVHCEAEDGSEETGGDFNDTLGFALVAMQLLASDLKYAERAAVERVLPGPVRTLMGVATKLYPSSLFVVRPQWYFNYSERELLRRYRAWLVNGRGGLVEETRFNELVASKEIEASGNIFVLGFPRVETERTLSHVAFGHELGHPIASVYIELGSTKSRIRDAVVQSARKKAGEEKEVGKPLTPKRMLKRAEDTRNAETLCSRAIEETMADVANAHIFGLAALLFTDRTGSLYGRDTCRRDPPETHYPPWRFRLREMMKVLSDDWFEGFVGECGLSAENEAAVRTEWDRLCVVKDGQEDAMSRKGFADLEIAYAALDDLLPEAVNHITHALKEQGIEASDLVGLVEWKLAERLLRDIPPDAVTSFDENTIAERMADYRGILNIGWLVQYCGVRDDDVAEGCKEGETPEPPLETLKRRERLVGKALEYADLREGRPNPITFLAE